MHRQQLDSAAETLRLQANLRDAAAARAALEAKAAEQVCPCTQAECIV